MMEAWPFLVSRNKSLDYQAVVAPPFMVEGRIAHVLDIVTSGNTVQKNEAIYREVHNTRLGDRTIIFHVLQAAEGKKILTDGFGRQIDFIEGLVYKGYKEGIIVTRQDFELIHNQIEEPFRNFWKEATRTQIRVSSQIILQDDKESTDQLRLIKLDAYNLDSVEKNKSSRTGNGVDFKDDSP